MSHKLSIGRVLNEVSKKQLSPKKAMRFFQDLPYKDLGFAKFDNHRALRRGFPEVVYCEGKTIRQIKAIVSHIIQCKGPLLLTRASAEHFKELKKSCAALRYNELARVIFLKRDEKIKKKGRVLIVTAGTSDIPVAEEARVTLELMGNRTKVLYDVGVAGIHRVLDKKRFLNNASVIIVAAGMEGALASVVSGLVSKPVIALPTSVGYGASFKGLSALLTMINCCSPGVAVVNIDNGFGAGYFASLINR